MASLGPDTVRGVLEYHIVGARISYSQATKSSGAVITTLGGATLTVSVSGRWFKRVTLIDNEPDLLDPTVVFGDIPASNGVAHAIDRVLLPADL